MRKRALWRISICWFWLNLVAGFSEAQLLVPRLLRQFDEKRGLSLTAPGMTQDAQGRLWLASTNGIVCFDGSGFRVFHDPVMKEGDYYYHLMASPDGRIWFKMSSGFSLSYIDTRQSRLVRVADTTRLVRAYLAKYGSHSFFADAQANLWIGLQQHGLLKVNPRTLAVEHLIDQGLDVRFITQDRRGVVYFTTAKQGLFAYNPQTGVLTNYRHNDKDTTSLSSDAAFGLQARPDGSILVGLINGADLFWPATGQFQHLGLNAQRTTNAQAPAYVSSFVLDATGNAYFTTGELTYRYTAQGVLQQLGFSSPTHVIRSLSVSASNRLWVSSDNTLNEYDLSQTEVFPSLLFLKLTINGTELRDNTSTTQNLVYDQRGHPTLTVGENVPFTMQFTVAAKLAPQTLRWRLNGYNPEWISSQDIQGEVAYQLPAGTYTFTVNQGARSGSWQPTVSTLTIVVVAPFWKTPAFLIFIGLMVVGLGYYFVRAYSRRRQLARQLARQQQEADSLRQLDELKTRFFSNVTHEFRTPLTIILNATEQLTAKIPTMDEMPEVALIQRHAHQLLRLITETLDIARLDAGKQEAHPQVGNPGWFIGQVVAQFAGLAAQRGIDLTYHTHPTTHAESGSDSSPNGRIPDEVLFRFEAETWEKIAYNLLANALKFTPTGGRVDVWGDITADQTFLLRVRDTGIGIPADQLERVFDRFHQVDARLTRAYSGTGIGLSLVRELTSWLGGQVWVESQPGQGSTFTVRLPLTAVDGEQAVLPMTPVDSVSEPIRQGTLEKGSLPNPLAVSRRDVPLMNGTGQPVLDESNPKPLILVVEDHDDLRSQVVGYLSGTYQVLSASTGLLGWEQALAQVPDVIVSDVMMPELDGYELLERLKTDERTSHIPVILLTARSAPESRMRGLHRGADDYLIKPFSLAELALRIGNGLRTRQQGQKRFLAVSTGAVSTGAVPTGAGVDTATVDVPPGAVSTGGASRGVLLPVKVGLDREEAFLDRLRQAILAQLTSDALDVDWLARQANMSRTQLNRKLSALTDLSPNRFIQRVRLERAAELLQEGTLSVAEVADQIGYNSPSHFTKVFQEHFGYPPARLKK
ncbi:ATP-binding protein [Spirosoma agri]|uniref:histidine kinase n=1 Tax=Spirosoma agri TaxID=1987381 RepID=A0A6M0IEM7_9BACT|nr:ATP-binding protein [Spirosoma agri]NEU66297.1 helix-turn-helix domain-containing protein [Spirosoma agri]